MVYGGDILLHKHVNLNVTQKSEVVYNYINMVPNRLDMMFHVLYLCNDDMHSQHTRCRLQCSRCCDWQKQVCHHSNKSVNATRFPLYSSRKFLSAMPPPLILRLEDRSTHLEAYLSLHGRQLLHHTSRTSRQWQGKCLVVYIDIRAGSNIYDSPCRSHVR